MKPQKIFFVIFVLILFAGFKVPGNFTYTKAEYVPGAQKLELELAIYNEHLDQLIEVLTGTTNVFDLDVKEQRLVFGKYLSDHFEVLINGQKHNFSLKGSYPFGNQTVLILQIGGIQDIQSIEFKNSILFDLNPDQQNFVDFTYGNFSFSDVCTRDKVSVKFILPVQGL